MMERILVTAALPYANGPLHVGHIAGAYLPADIYSRYQRQKGNDVLFICGTDEHGTPISVSAEKEGVSPQDIVDKYHGIQSDAFNGLGIRFDNFSGTSRKIHHELSQEFFSKANENGYIYELEVERPFCPSCDRFLPDRYVHGTCPECETPDQRGDQCEACGKQLESGELLDMSCAICGGSPVMRKTRHWYLKLSAFSERLSEYVEGNTHWPSNARNFAKGWIKEGLRDRAITRDLDWGIPVPAQGAEGKVLYVWFDAPIGYISSTKEWALEEGGDWESYWRDGKIIHFIGKDNIPFHTVFWPAILMSHGGFKLPWQIASNEYLNLEGRKMSTSRGWVLWLHELLEEYPVDIIRYYLTSISPENHDSDFSLSEMGGKVNQELVATLGNFVNRVLTFIQKEGGEIPERGVLEEADEEFLKLIHSSHGHVGESIESLRMRQALQRVMELAKRGNEYFQHKQPWKNNPDTTLSVCCEAALNLAVVMNPILPESAQKLWEMLGQQGKVEDVKWGMPVLVKAKTRLEKPSILFKKIEDESLQQFKKKHLPAEDESGKEEEKKAEGGIMAKVCFEDFSRLDIRVGEIRSAEPHPNADKLLLLNVDLGELGHRQIVAGIKDSYRLSELAGRQIAVVANLEPAVIRGVESQGMLLAAEDADGKPLLLSPEKQARTGVKIR